MRNILETQLGFPPYQKKHEAFVSDFWSQTLLRGHHQQTPTSRTTSSMKAVFSAAKSAGERQRFSRGFCFILEAFEPKASTKIDWENRFLKWKKSENQVPVEIYKQLLNVHVIFT